MHTDAAPDDVIDVEAPDEPARALVPVAHASLLTAAPVADAVALQRQYHALCDALLEPSDYQRIGDRTFRKKSAWRKLAVAFGVSTSVAERIYERDESGRLTRAEVVARAVAPNGRTVEGLGVCSLFERCCLPGCRRRHSHCPAASEAHCSGLVHFSNPEHDVPSTAHTRATNRALADLFGAGEVSAEEVTAAGDTHDDNDDTRQRRGPGSPPASSETSPAAIEARVDALSADAHEAFAEWRDERRLPWPPASSAVCKAMAAELDRIEAAGGLDGRT